jgi:hypothetical protein
MKAAAPPPGPLPRRTCAGRHVLLEAVGTSPQAGGSPPLAATPTLAVATLPPSSVGPANTLRPAWGRPTHCAPPLPHF